MTHHLSIDIETYCSVDLKKCGLYRYVQSADLEILLFAYSLDHQPVQVIDLAQGEPLPDEILKMLADETVVKHAYNAAFEINCLAKFYAISNPTSWRCTMAHGLYCGYPAGLERISKAMGLESDKAKMAIGKALIRLFSVPCKPTARNGGRTRNLPRHEPAKWELFKTYCGQDVVAEMTVEDRLAKYPMPTTEQRLWELDLKTNQLGVRIDTDLVDGAIDCAEEKTKELMAEATSISRLDNPNSAAQLKAWLAEEGVETSDLTKKTVKDLLTQVELGPAKRILEIRQELAKTSVKKYEAMRSAVCDDDRVRGLLQYYGANRTGRWCLAEGTMVTVKTEEGVVTEKVIEKVLRSDRVWDGGDWVDHEGVVYSGDKDVIEWDGIKATPEHQVWVSPYEKLSLVDAKSRKIRLWRGAEPWKNESR